MISMKTKMNLLELVKPYLSLIEVGSTGLSVYYAFDGLITRFSLGWLSIGRVIGLTCVAAVVGMPFYLKQEQPLSWQQIVQMLSGESPAPKPGNLESASSTESIQTESDPAVESPQVPPSIAAVDKLVENSLSRTNEVSPPLDELVIAAPETDVTETDTPDVDSPQTETSDSPLLTESPADHSNTSGFTRRRQCIEGGRRSVSEINLRRSSNLSSRCGLI